MQSQIIEKLKSSATTKNKAFSEKLIFTRYEILGVDTPTLKKILKNLSLEEQIEILNTIDTYNYKYYEEILLTGYVICKQKGEFGQVLNYVEKFLPLIDNWATCDIFCCAFKIADKNNIETFNFVKKCINQNKEFYVRVGYVLIIAHLIKPEFIDDILNLYNDNKLQDYYVQMAIAWGISVCFTKFREKTLAFLKQNQLSVFIQNKAISKICDSFKVSKEDKLLVKALKKA